MKKILKALNIFLLFIPLLIFASDNPAFDYIKNADADSFLKIKDNISDWDLRDDRGNTLLLYAFRTLFEHEMRNRGRTALHYAVLNKDIYLINLLIENGADVSAKDENGESPYLLARKSGMHEIADMMINCVKEKATNNDTQTKDITGNSQKSKNFEKNNNKIKENLLTIIDNILDKQIDINAVDETGKNSLHYAVLTGNYDLSKKLIEKGIDVNVQDKKSDTSLIIAAREGEWAIAGLLLENKADVNIKKSNNIITPDEKQPASATKDEFAKPEEYNFKFIVNGASADNPDKDLRSYYQVYIDKQEQGRTSIGLDSQAKDYTAKLSINKHLLSVEKYVLDKKQERYIKLNNIDQPNPNYYYFEIPQDRIVIIILKHDNEKKTAEFSFEYEMNE